MIVSSNRTLQANRMKSMRTESPHLDSVRLLISFIATTHTRFPPTSIGASALKKWEATKGGIWFLRCRVFDDRKLNPAPVKIAVEYSFFLRMGIEW